MRERLRVVVVGGSIAGCATGAALIAAGHHVAVHERVAGPLLGGGIGIGVDPSTLARLVDHGLLDQGVPRIEVAVVRYLYRATRTNGDTRWVGDAGLPAAMIDWSALYRGLRGRLPATVYAAGNEVVATDDGSDIRLAGFEESPDLIVFADGYRSAGRALVAPHAISRYRGLVMWRGLVPERDVDVRDLENARIRVLYAGGHGVAYLLPGADGSTTPGDRRVMWGYYLPVPETDLGTVLTDRDGRPHSSSVELGSVHPDVAVALRSRLAPLLPDCFLDLVDRSPATSLQAIHSVDVERTHRHQACLVGDAATVFPPYSGSGVLKAVDDALSLRASLDAAGSVRDALVDWSATQDATTRRIRPIADRNGRQLVHEVPDLAAMSTAERNAWLAALHPDTDLVLDPNPA